MKTTPAWRWLAAGVLALGLNGWYHTGGAHWARIAIGQLAHHTETVLELAKSRAHRFLTEAHRLGALPVDSSNVWQSKSALDRGCKQSSQPQSL
jgi:hypothetical protein